MRGEEEDPKADTEERNWSFKQKASSLLQAGWTWIKNKGRKLKPTLGKLNDDNYDKTVITNINMIRSRNVQKTMKKQEHEIWTRPELTQELTWWEGKQST